MKLSHRFLVKLQIEKISFKKYFQLNINKEYYQVYCRDGES